LHKRGEVSERTKKKILKIISELDYKPNIFASNLASKKSAVFATLLPHPPSKEGYWNKPFIGIQKRIDELQQYGIQISPFTFSQTDRTEFAKEAAKVIELKPDGVVFAPFFKKESFDFIENLKKHSIPFVFIDSEIKEAGQISYIGQDSYQSGLVSGKLLDLMLPSGNILIIHFAKEMDNQNHLIEREKGFYDWYNKNSKDGHQLFTTEVSNTDDETWMDNVKNIIETNNIKGVFVTNSRVYFAGRLIEKYNFNDIKLIGHDLVKWNVEFLKKGIVQFLICQRPEEQGYKAINKLFKFVVEKNSISNQTYTSIDIITKENIDYYKEFK
jgi:LacI family transcriptional regulator